MSAAAEDGIRREVRASPAYERVPERGRVKLNQNESPWDVPDAIKAEVARRLAASAWNRYPQEGVRRLRGRLAEPFGIPAEGIVLASGSNLAMEWIAAAATGPGRRTLVPAPSFGLYRPYGEVFGGAVEEVPFGPDLTYDAGRWCEAMERVRPSLAILCTPNNPTGSDLDDASIERIAGAAPGLVLIDEAYRDFAERDRRGMLARHANIILLRTFSKAFAAAGLRIGYLAARPEVAREIGKLAPPFHASVFTVAAAETLLDHRDLFADRIRALLAERERLVARLAALPGVRPKPTSANFFLIEVARGDPDEARRRAVGIAEALRARGILVRIPDPRLAGMLRVNVGTPEEDDALIEGLGEILGTGGA
ncbi:MAG: aminotransferase class I/II-fold pyridoxal phosphate-dependent enzyme [Planctomycetes bacterium]|nr:aminotransferase class I/II-fold pyridoxal phosphate-dependent enzyme [Planctomycetota bacterium]